jgi:hypothetical protein
MRRFVQHAILCLRALRPCRFARPGQWLQVRGGRMLPSIDSACRAPLSPEVVSFRPCLAKENPQGNHAHDRQRKGGNNDGVVQDSLFHWLLPSGTSRSLIYNELVGFARDRGGCAAEAKKRPGKTGPFSSNLARFRTCSSHRRAGCSRWRCCCDQPCRNTVPRW